jgi:hypothetical protein
MPPSYATKLRYFETVEIDPGTGTPTQYSFSANGLFDPNYTGTGHQPRGFDQLMLMYNHYIVVGAKITCTFHSLSPIVSVVAGIHVGTDVTATPDLTDIIEQGNRKYVVLGGNSEGDNTKTVTEYCSIKKEFGLKDIRDNASIKGHVTGNPTEQCYFHIFTCAQNEVSNPTVVETSVLIDYLVIFTEPNDLDKS